MTVPPFIIIPVYNHSGTLRDVVEKALAVSRDVIVVDDGSTDQGAGVLDGLPASVIRHEENLGKGAAILTGAREALSRGATHIVTIDADGQHDPADYTRFLTLIEEDPEAIVVGTRDFDPATTPRLSRFGRAFSNFWLRVQTGHKLRDTQSGFRSYPLVLLEWLKVKERHYDFEIEVLVKAVWAGITLRDVTISVWYPPASKRISHFRLFRDNLRLTLLNTKLTMRALTPYPHRKFRGEGVEKLDISIFHPIRSLRLLLTGNNSPERLAIAGGVGVFINTLPLIACQSVATLFAANYLQLNKLMALAAGQICMPPLVPALCIEVGYFMRHGRFLTEISLETIGYQALERILEWLLGSLILGPVIGILSGIVIYVAALFLKRESHGT